MSGKSEYTANEIVKLYEGKNIKTEEFQMGIDEAGRGPVFGAMVYGAAWWPIKSSEQFVGIGFDDSKKLSEAKRQQLFKVMQSIRNKAIFYKEEILTAVEISNKMFGQGAYNQNLNQQSHNAAIRLIQYVLDEGFNLKKVFLDTVGDPKKYQNKLNQRFSTYNLQIVVTSKADSLFKVVSAASIVAKVTRDHLLRDWKFVEPIETVGELGSGYPSDPKTKQWLQLNKDPVFGYPSLIRFSWGTCTEAMQPAVLSFPSEMDEKQKKKIKTTRLGERFNIIQAPGVFIS